jgi:hypothetical protein
MKKETLNMIGGFGIALIILFSLIQTLHMKNTRFTLEDINERIKTNHPFKIIDAKQIDSSTTYSVGLNKGDGYFNITQSLDKFSALGIDCDSIILYSNL